MASSTLLKDLEENFFMCSVCLDKFKEPKQLPCLHRYCTTCLETVIQSSNDGTIKCPMCNQGCVLPENGVHGFKSDFHMKSMLEFIQLKKSFENKDLQVCVSCSKQTTMSAYCFKCRDFLCDQCYNVHVSSKMFTDHEPRTLKLNNIEARNLTLEKLSTLTENPRCRAHVEKNADLCCSTCGNEPVCMICTYSKHKGHDLHDVTELAKTEREMLEPKLAELNKNKSKIYELPKKIEEIKLHQLNKNVEKMKEKLTNQHAQQAGKIKDKLEELNNKQERGLMEIERRRKDKECQTNINYEKEFKILNENYDKIRNATKREFDNERDELKQNCDNIEGKLLRKVESLASNFKRLKTATELLTVQNTNELKEISDYCEHIIKRYENFTATTSSILASKDEWTDVQCIPDIRAACEPLIEKMKREFPELESLSDIWVNDITKVIVDDVTISEHAESVVNVKGIKAKGWAINGIMSSKDGNIVITGFVSDEYSHITVINRKGEIQRQDQIKGEKKFLTNPYRYCCYLSEFKVATVCMPDEIGIYDVRDGLYNKKNISDVISSWPSGQRVLCVTTDPVNNHIIVGITSRYVYVFDDQLSYSHTITLPDVISGLHGITVHGDSLLICDHIGKRAHAVTMKGSESQLMYEFTRPDLDGGGWRPSSVCKDNNGFIYMLWRQVSGQWRCVLVQYSQDGRQLLATRTVDGDAWGLATSEAEESEKLLLATFKSGKLYTYGLIVT